jgi:hypothetical protein
VFAFWLLVTALALKVIYLAIALGARDGFFEGLRVFVRMSILGPLLLVGARFLWRRIARLPYTARIPTYTVAGLGLFIIGIMSLTLLLMPVPEPDSVPDTVVQTIAALPEFERVGSDLQVSGTNRRGGDSSGIYTANVSFVPLGSSAPVIGQAYFTWRQERWHANSLTYYEAGGRKTIRFATD